MGSQFIITIDATDTADISKAVMASFELVDSMNRIFSDYDIDSELNRINDAPANVWLDISYEMSQLLHKSQQACYISDGHFDITIGLLTKAWRNTRNTGVPLSSDSITFIKKYCGCKQYIVNTQSEKVFKKNEVFQFDVGGIAKGYIAEKVSHYLKSAGWSRHLIDAGGDLMAGDAPDKSYGWKIAIELPQSEQIFEKTINIKNQAVATSGSTYQYYRDGMKIFSHIINPETGQGVSSQQNTTVIAPSGTDADWLATACTLLTWRKSKKLIKQFADSSLIITHFNKRNRSFRISGKLPDFHN